MRFTHHALLFMRVANGKEQAGYVFMKPSAVKEGNYSMSDVDDRVKRRGSSEKGGKAEIWGYGKGITARAVAR